MLPPSNDQGVQGPEYAALSRRGSVRSGASVVRLDTFCAPQTRVTAHLTPKIFDLHVKLRNHAAAVVDLDAGPNLSLSWQPLRAASKHFLVIDKPPSLPSIEPADNPESALSPHWLRRILPRQLAQGYLSITGRLDAGTHGLMVISRSPAYTGLFNKEIQARRVKKKYVAVVLGWNPVANPNHKVGAWTHYYIKRNSLDVGQHDIFLTLSPGQGSLVEHHTDFDRMRFIASRSLQHPYTVPVQLIVTKAIEANERSKALRCFHPAVTKRMLMQTENAPLFELHIDLITGKTHQIRAQLWAEGLSIVGDWLYSSHDLPNPDTFALSCTELGWTCPVTGVALEYSVA